MKEKLYVILQRPSSALGALALQITIRIFHTGILAKCVNEKRMRCSSNSFRSLSLHIHVKWVPCQHGMALSEVTDGGEGVLM
jgi:hypothetical protein